MANENEIVSGILDTIEDQGAILEPVSEIYSDFIEKEALQELKHSIRVHMLMMNGPTQQLCTLMLKLPDLMGDADKDRRNNETKDLAFIIVEGLALYVQRSIDDRADRAQGKGEAFPKSIKEAGDKILVAIGQNRSSSDKIASKNAVLRSVADALRSLSTFTKAIYPDIYDSNGNQL